MGRGIVCLVGHGDTTKSTILDAIEYALCPNWFIPIDDSDFTDCNTHENIEIIATVGPVPDEFMCESKYGLYLKQWSIRKKKLIDDEWAELERGEGSIYALSIKITIDHNLTPEWMVVTNAHPEGVHMPHKDREKISVARIGENIDNELAWTRGSSLLRLSEDRKEMERYLLEANRKLRDMLTPEVFKSLEKSVNTAKTSGQMYGIRTDDFRANIDPKVLRGSSSTVSLHDNTIPFRRMGIGTRRLMAIGLQLHCIEREGGILLIDEIEHALEPHRLKYLLRILCGNIKKQSYGQVFMTTQCPATLEELEADSLYCVRYDDAAKASQAIRVDRDIQGTVRRTPEGFLSPNVVVCEGPTEIGLLRAYENSLIKRHGDKRSFAYNKTVLINGEGTSASKRACDLAQQNFRTCLFIDSDKVPELSVSESELIEGGVYIVRWENGNDTERQLFSDLPKERIKGAIAVALGENDKLRVEAILESVNCKLEVKLKSMDEIALYPEGDMATLRSSISGAAKRNGWFKSVTAAEVLGNYLFDEISHDMCGTPFYARFEEVRSWAIDEQ
jgi:hypothetical protein